MGAELNEETKKVAMVFANPAGTWIDFANPDGTCIDGVRLSPHEETLLITVRGYAPIVGSATNPIWTLIGGVVLFDTKFGIVVRRRCYGPFLSELCPWIRVVSITDENPAPGESFSLHGHDYNRRDQLEIVRFDRELFRLYLLKRGGTRQILEVINGS